MTMVATEIEKKKKKVIEKTAIDNRLRRVGVVETARIIKRRLHESIHVYK